jgi:hypothetical protein
MFQKPWTNWRFLLFWSFSKSKSQKWRLCWNLKELPKTDCYPYHIPSYGFYLQGIRAIVVEKDNTPKVRSIHKQNGCFVISSFCFDSFWQCQLELGKENIAECVGYCILTWISLGNCGYCVSSGTHLLFKRWHQKIWNGYFSLSKRAWNCSCHWRTPGSY